MSEPLLCVGERRLPAGRPLAAHRRERRRWRRWLWIVPAVALACAAVVLGARWALTADRFAVSRVETGPYRFSEPRDLERRLATALGCNIWTREGERRLREQLAASPWVRQVDVARELPGTLRVRIDEWRPLVAVQPDSQTAARGAARGALVLCGDGRVVPFPAHLPQPDLPLLVGAGLEPAGASGNGAAAWRLAGGLAERVLALHDAVAETGLEAVAPIDFVVAGADGLTLVLQDGRGRLRLGDGGFVAGLRRYLAVRGELAAGATVDLRFGRRVFVGAAGPADDGATEGAAGSPAVGRGATGAGGAAAAAAGARPLGVSGQRSGKSTGGQGGSAARRSDARA